MIYEVVSTFQADLKVLKHWFRKEQIPNLVNNEQEHRIQVAAARMIADIAMVFGALWALSILTFIVTIPLKIALNLALAVNFYALAHDVFIMSHNFAQSNLNKSEKLWDLFKGQKINDEARARQFTQGTFLQPVWMWLYVHRNQLTTLK